MCIHQQHYDQLLNLCPELPAQEAKAKLPIPSKPMACEISVKHRGESFLRAELVFLYPAGDKWLPDHKMLLRVDFYERKVLPESIWFQGKGTQNVHVPKQGKSDAIRNVLTRRLDDWLANLTAQKEIAN